MHASFLAGLAFTRKYVGYVHAIAHAIGGFYNTQHGYTNALLLPIVLEAYGSSIDKKMAKLYDFLYGPSTDSNHQKCVYLIKIIRKFNEDMGIVSSFKTIIKEKDIPLIVEHSYHEANPLYPVSKILSKKDFENIIRRLM
jgi:alcohol dehydrogenase class IV